VNKTDKWFQRIAAQIRRSLSVSTSRDFSSTDVFLLAENALAILDPVTEPMPPALADQREHDAEMLAWRERCLKSPLGHDPLSEEQLRRVGGYLRQILAQRLPEKGIDGLAPGLARAIRQAYSQEPPDARLARN
jgi:hypothetical protein